MLETTVELEKWTSVSPCVEALAEIERGKYHLVLMDFLMPKMDGTTATRFIRDKEAKQGTRRLPVVGITSDTRSNWAGRCRSTLSNPC